MLLTSEVETTRNAIPSCHRNDNDGQDGPPFLVQSLVNTPQIQRKTTVTYDIKQQKNVTLRTSLTGLSVLLRNAIVIIYSRSFVHRRAFRRLRTAALPRAPSPTEFLPIRSMVHPRHQALCCFSANPIDYDY